MTAKDLGLALTEGFRSIEHVKRYTTTGMGTDQGKTSNVNALALDEELDLACRLGNPTGLGIHNKMVLVSVNGRGYVHVGSINGTEQSSKGNSELALQVQALALKIGKFTKINI